VDAPILNVFELQPAYRLTTYCQWADATVGDAGGRITPDSPQEERTMKRIAVAVVASLALLLGATAAAADPDFGPGNSSKGPNDGGSKCHPPGQTEFEPGCK
jgi:hypothetical protein